MTDVNMKMTDTAAFNDQHNHDSFTDVGTGAFVISFNRNMSTTNYTLTGCTQDGYICGYTNLAADSFRGYNYDTDGTKVDLAQVCFATFEVA